MVNITNAQLGRRLLRRRCHCALSDSPQRPDDTRPTPTRGKPRAFRSSVARTPSPHVYKFARRPESHRALPSAQPFHARATDVDAHARRVHASRAASHTPAAATATDQCTQNNTRRAKPRTHPDRFRPLPCPRFQVLLISLSGYFSSFVHTTSSLSVETPYLVLAVMYPPLCAQFPKYATLQRGNTTHYRHSAVPGFHRPWRTVPE